MRENETYSTIQLTELKKCITINKCFGFDTVRANILKSDLKIFLSYITIKRNQIQNFIARNIPCTVKQCYFLNHLTNRPYKCQDHPAGGRKETRYPKSSHSVSVIIEAMGPLQKQWMSLLAASRLIGELFEAGMPS